MSKVKISGFDYTAKGGTLSVSHTLERWKEIVAAVLAAGGRRRVDGGDTLLFAPTGVMVYEAWANVPAPKSSPVNQGVNSRE